MPFPRKPMGQLKALLCGMAWSPFLPLICCIILDKSLSLSKALLFHQQNWNSMAPRPFLDDHKTHGEKQQTYPSRRYMHPNWHCHMEHEASKWGFLWAQESLVPHSRTQGVSVGLWESVVELGSTQRAHPASLLLHSVLPAGAFWSLWLLAFLAELIPD